MQTDMMNDETARANMYANMRFNMIEQQIRPWNVLQMQTLTALAEIRREYFVPDQYKSLAFADVLIPIDDSPASSGRVMLEPKVGARMIESMAIQPNQRVLQIGTGTGYLTALLATLCEHVTSIEIDAPLSRHAGINLAMAGITNVQLIDCDCFAFCRDFGQSIGSQNGKFDAVLITGSVPKIEQTFLNMINDSGCVVGIEGDNPAMQVVVYRNGDRQSLFETSVPRLVNANDKPCFTF